MIRQTLSPLTRSTNEEIAADDAVHLIQQSIIPVDVAYLKSTESLKRSLREIERIESDVVPKLSASSAHELVKAIEVRSMATVAKLMTIASLTREESRGFHFRKEFPKTDNEKWLKWVMLHKDERGETEIRVENVPTPYLKPTEAYSDPPGTQKV